MKKNLKRICGLFLFFACAICLWGQEVNFLQEKNAAGKASLTSDAYYSSFTIGTANFSPELRLPIQIFYDSSVKDEGIAGVGWKIPQLESSAVPSENGAIWTTPWGEKVNFYSRRNTSKDVLSLFNETERENAYFSPYADWTANGRADSGSWTIYGRKDMRGWKFVYLEGKLRSITAPSGDLLTFRYDNGRIVSVEQRGNSFVSLKYNEDKILSEILINGVSNKFVFADGKVQILPETLAGNEERVESKFLRSVGQRGLNPLEFAYDSAGYLSRIKRGGYVDEISVEHESLAQRKDYLKRVAAAKKANRNIANIVKEAVAGRIVKDSSYSYSYPSGKFGNVELANKRGEVAKYEFDSQRGISRYTDFSGKEMSTYYFMRYDVAYNGKVRQIVDGRKRVLASYRYDKDTGKITRYRDNAKNDINFKYDSRGNLIGISKRGAGEPDALPVRSFEYIKGEMKPSRINELDSKGRVVRTTSIQYDASRRPVMISDGCREVKIGYNFYGYPIKFVDGFGLETSISYDRYNRRISRESGEVLERIEYDSNGFPVKVSAYGGGKELRSLEVCYGKDGYPETYKDSEGLSKRFERDGRGRVLKEIFPDLTEVKYGYDELGNLGKVVDQNGHEIKFEWGANGLDRRKTAVGQITENRYDEYGRLSAVESRYENGSIDKSISYGYDELDRLAKISYGASENETIKYDSWGRIIEKSKNGLVSRFKYDHFGRLVEKREGGSTTKYAYDNYGRRISRVTEKGGEVLDERNTYDKYGRLVKTESNGETVEYVYDKKNRLSGQKMGGVKVEYAYTEYGQVSRKSLIGADGKILSEIKYWYSPSGNITSRLANGKRQEYKYDAKNQLLAVIDAESKLPVESYEYDASGNILQKTIKGETTTYTYDAANQLVSSTNPEGDITSYAYDAAGRLVQEGEKSYEYGWLDKVTRILENGKEVARFEYHNNNQLAKVVRENGIETFEWDGLALIERNGTKYINEPHAGGGNPILAIGGDGQKTEAIFTDILGTSIGKVSGNGYSAIDKTSFGADTTDKSSFFTGKPYVEGLGYVFLLRNYRADMGKWLSADLIGYPDGWNNFAYCGNNIIDSIDFLGCAKKYIKTRDLDTDIIGLRNMQHSWTEIWVTREEYNNMSSEYKSGEFEGKWKNYGSTDDYYSITLSANRDPETGNLIKQTGDPKDSGAKNIYDYGHDFDLSSIEGVLENHKNYNNQADYDEIPYYGDKNNCNSYTNTINNGDLPDGIKNNPYCPGINSTIDGKYYE